jgi:hypothetical protein
MPVTFEAAAIAPEHDTPIVNASFTILGFKIIEEFMPRPAA